LGWMAEMCIELLDDDEMLASMRDSRCRIIYCGLESIDEVSLRFFHKMNTNHVENYERIIRKVQSYGIQIAAGLILGSANTTKDTFVRTYNFFNRMGIIYVKLTFLTFNPGTKAKKYMEKKGIYLAENYEEYDGLRMSYLPEGVSKNVVIEGVYYFIKKYYSTFSLLKRAISAELTFLGKAEFFLFSYCYAESYRKWISSGYLYSSENFSLILNEKFHKPLRIIIAEKLLIFVRSYKEIHKS